MMLLIDAGNTRIKWAQLDNGKWINTGVFVQDQLVGDPWESVELKKIRQIWVSNVAGEQVKNRVLQLGVKDTRFISAQESQCGVTNGYRNAAHLGSDRWAALIGAWNLIGNRCLVVNSGTATTIDALSEQGEFLGGIILPGVELMQKSLAGATAKLQVCGGNYEKFPLNTSDALYSGPLQATCGAIERQKAMLGTGKIPIILSGGAAQMIKPCLNMPINEVENLVLQGLYIIAKEANTE
jgi:type III pantothenate kinase